MQNLFIIAYESDRDHNGDPLFDHDIVTANNLQENMPHEGVALVKAFEMDDDMDTLYSVLNYERVNPINTLEQFVEALDIYTDHAAETDQFGPDHCINVWERDDFETSAPEVAN